MKSKKYLFFVVLLVFYLKPFVVFGTYDVNKAIRYANDWCDGEDGKHLNPKYNPYYYNISPIPETIRQLFDIT